MPVTKKQDKRLDLLDQLLRTKKWLLKELLDRVNTSLDGQRINKRTLFRDIDHLINEDGAPIHRPEKGDNLYYYTYNFSRKTVPIDEDDIAVLKRAASVLRQVDAFDMMEEIDAVIEKLEVKTHSFVETKRSFIQFEKHTVSLGHEHIANLLDAMECKTTIQVVYHPFSQKEPKEVIIHPYLLKEYRNRWFLLGRKGDDLFVSNYALDRVKKIKPSAVDFIENDLFDPDRYFDLIIGVSVPRRSKPRRIELKVSSDLSPYINSKPIHRFQEVKQLKDGSAIVKLYLYNNYELRAVLLSYGPGLEVRKPKSLRDEMEKLLKTSLENYKH